MFENIIEQGAVLQLRDDIINRRNAPSMLFFGPAGSAKGSAALELSRVLSCEQEAEWKCACSSCECHRYLQHDDLLVLGRTSFYAEIMACYSAFTGNPSSHGAKLLFFRSLRKLMLRFSPVVMEDDPKLSKISSVLQSLDEGLGLFWTSEQAALIKLCDSLVKDAVTLENDGLGSIIPIGHIRRASYWCRLAPNGKRKTLVIEYAENLRDEGRNSLLKLLEEPPASVSIVLTAQRREAIMPTILSRVRPYRFLKRSAESEKEVIRRVFQGDVKTESDGSLISAYLDSFGMQSTEKFDEVAAWFMFCLARMASQKGRTNAFTSALLKHCTPKANAAGLGDSLKSASVVKTVLTQCNNFKDDTFSRFMKICLDIICEVTRSEANPQFIAYNDIFKKYTGDAVTAVDVLNINAAIALESLFFNLKTAVIKGLSSKSLPPGKAYG